MMRASIVLVLTATVGCVTVNPAPAHPRVSPMKTPRATEVCWLETAGTDAPGAVAVSGLNETETWHATASALLVKHPDGFVVVDTGAPPDLERDLRESDSLSAFLIRDNSGLMERRGTLPDELAKAGVNPHDPKLRIVLSHAHPDHMGGLAALADVPVLLPASEVAFVQAEVKNGGSAHALPPQVRTLRGRTVTFSFDDGPYETFDRSKDLFGDGSVVLVPLPGHTPGSVGTFVNLSSGRRIFHIGDVALVEESIDRSVTKGVLLSLITDVDRDETADTVALVAQLHAAAPDVVILPAHDRDQWAKAVAPRAPKSPPVCVR